MFLGCLAWTDRSRAGCQLQALRFMWRSRPWPRPAAGLDGGLAIADADRQPFAAAPGRDLTTLVHFVAAVHRPDVGQRRRAARQAASACGVWEGEPRLRRVQGRRGRTPRSSRRRASQDIAGQPASHNPARERPLD